MHIRECPAAIEDAEKCAPKHVYTMRTRSQTQQLPQPPPVPKLKPERFVPVARGLRGGESKKRYETFYIRHHERRGLAINVCKKSRKTSKNRYSSVNDSTQEQLLRIHRTIAELSSKMYLMTRMRNLLLSVCTFCLRQFCVCTCLGLWFLCFVQSFTHNK